MATRSFEFITGIETGDLPAAASPVTGTFASPQLVTAIGGLAPDGNAFYEVLYVKGSGGAIDVTANPQIAAGEVDGQLLVVIGTDDTATVTLENGTGIAMDGDAVLQSGSSIMFAWDDAATIWRQVGGKGRC